MKGRKLLSAAGWLDIAAALACGAASAVMTVFFCIRVWNDAANSESFVGVAAIIGVPTIALFFGFPTVLLFAYCVCGVFTLRQARSEQRKKPKGMLVCTACTFATALFYGLICCSFLYEMGQYAAFSFALAGLAAFGASLILKIVGCARRKSGAVR